MGAKKRPRRAGNSKVRGHQQAFCSACLVFLFPIGRYLQHAASPLLQRTADFPHPDFLGGPLPPTTAPCYWPAANWHRSSARH